VPNLLKVLTDSSDWDNNGPALIDEDNFDLVFEQWKNMVPTGHNTQTCVQAFFEDLGCNGVTQGCFICLATADDTILVPSPEHANFWSKHTRPKNLKALSAQKDRLVDLWSRRTEGEFFTPDFYAKLGHKYIHEHLKDKTYQTHWWDMCCGTGNLTKPCPEEMKGRLFLSTLNQEDIDILLDESAEPSQVFSQDFLNTDDNYAFLENVKEWVFILNPPYSASPTVRDEHKKGVGETLVGARMKEHAMNKAASNLTTQFLWKIAQIAKKYKLNITVGMFTQISFVMNPSYAQFYKDWLDVFGFVNGFCFHCSEFEGTTGEWPVVFSTWSTDCQGSSNVTVDIYEQRKLVGTKSFAPARQPLSKWVDRPKNTQDAPPFTSAMTVASLDKTINLCKLPDNALGFAVFAANDVMHSKQAYLLSSPYANGSGWGVLESNFEQSMVALGLRAIIKGTWLNDRDQFNVPDTTSEHYESFKNDLIMWLLFSNFNHSASLECKFMDTHYDIQNHFFWKEGRFAGDWLKGRSFGDEAVAILQHCNKLYDMLQQYSVTASPDYQLSRWDAGWYQWRKALCGKNSPNKVIVEMYSQYKKKHKALTDALVPKVYELGVLPREMYFDKMKNSKQVRLHKLKTLE